jgi:uncharacterized membrane protein (DUF2068 family)
MGMKRSALLASVALMQLLLGVLFSGVCIFLLSLIPEVIPGRNAAAAIWGLKVAAAIIGPLAVLVLASLYGVWKGKRWGWWLALVGDAALGGILVYSLIDDGWKNVDWTVVVLMAVPMVALVFLLLPKVRGVYWQSGDLPVATA